MKGRRQNQTHQHHAPYDEALRMLIRLTLAGEITWGPVAGELLQKIRRTEYLGREVLFRSPSLQWNPGLWLTGTDGVLHQQFFPANELTTELDEAIDAQLGPTTVRAFMAWVQEAGQAYTGQADDQEQVA